MEYERRTIDQIAMTLATKQDPPDPYYFSADGDTTTVDKLLKNIATLLPQDFFNPGGSQTGRLWLPFPPYRFILSCCSAGLKTYKATEDTPTDLYGKELLFHEDVLALEVKCDELHNFCMKHYLPLPLFWFGEEKQSPEYFVRYRKIFHNLYDADNSVLVSKIEELYVLSTEYMNDKKHNVEDRIKVHQIRWMMENDLPQMPDPAKEAEDKFWWDHCVKVDMLKEDYKRVESMTPENLSQDEYKKKEMKRLECELEAMAAVTYTPPGLSPKQPAPSPDVHPHIALIAGYLADHPDATKGQRNSLDAYRFSLQGVDYVKIYENIKGDTTSVEDPKSTVRRWIREAKKLLGIDAHTD